MPLRYEQSQSLAPTFQRARTIGARFPHAWGIRPHCSPQTPATLFKSPGGNDGAIVAMSRDGGTVSTRGLLRSKGEKIIVTVFNGNNHGGVASHVQPRGDDTVSIPDNGAVAIKTKE